MFTGPTMIVILMYLLSANTPVDEPYRFVGKESYTDLAACQEYLLTPAFAQRRQNLQDMLTTAIAAHVDDAGNGNVPATVALTVSCAEDHRI